MSVQAAIRRKTAPDIRARKGGTPIVMLTSYHAHTAALVDRHCDAILVGDSLGNVMHGFETTVPVTLDMMILQGRAVMRGSAQALVVVDMPFGSYEASKEQAFHSAVRIMKETQCGAVKLEGGVRMAETVAFLAWAVYDRISLKRRTDAGAPPIPVGCIGNDLIAVAVGVVAYLALAFAFHPVVIGVPVMGS